MIKVINKSFVYGISVTGDNFTDRVKETQRLKMNFENGQNVILISPRRIGKTSLVRRVQEIRYNPKRLFARRDSCVARTYCSTNW